jgi:transposase
MELAEVQFSYLEKTMRHKVSRCPECGQVYLPEELVVERIRKVEWAIEEK